MIYALRQELIEILLRVPASTEYAGRDSLLAGVPHSASLRRSESNRRTDIEFIVDQLADTFLDGGESALGIVLDNASTYVAGTQLGHRLKELQRQLTLAGAGGVDVGLDENWGAVDDLNIPPLLPHLCDRSPQEEELDIALQRYKEQKPRRPFICIIHGGADECHDQFKERLQKNSLPKLLGFGNEDYSIPDFFLTWPSSFVSREQFLTIFHRNLAERVISRTASRSDVSEFISGQPGPLMMYSYLSTSGWNVGSAEMMRAFMEYWGTFPDLPPGHSIIYFLFFTHKGASRKFTLSRNRAVSFFKQQDFTGSGGVYGTVLPELVPVGEEDVKNWIRNDTIFRDFCPAHAPRFCELSGPLRDIRALFQQPHLTVNVDAKPCLPMDTLVEYLARIINRHRCAESRL
jgi:hypothetical protein